MVCIQRLLLILLLAMAVSAKGMQNELGIGIGVARFYSNLDNQTPGNQKMQGSLWANRIMQRNFSLGILADFSLLLCPVCEDSPDDDLKAIAVVGGAGIDYLPIKLQAGAGIGAAMVENGIYVEGGETTEESTTVDIPLLARATVGREYRKIGIGIGIELKYHMNFENSAFFASIPLILTF